PLPRLHHSTLLPYTTLFRSPRLHSYQKLGSTHVRELGRSSQLSKCKGFPHLVTNHSFWCSIALYLTFTTHTHSSHRAYTGSALRSEEHTSELQSLRHLVCRL